MDGICSSSRMRPARSGALSMASSTASNASSDSPMKKASKKGAIGAGLEALGPPAITIGSEAPRSAARIGMPARSSTSSTFE